MSGNKEIKRVSPYYQEKLFGLLEEALRLKNTTRANPGLVDRYEEAVHSLFMLLPPECQVDIEDNLYNIEEKLDQANDACLDIMRQTNKPLFARQQECFSVKKKALDEILHAVIAAIHKFGLSLVVQSYEESP